MFEDEPFDPSDLTALVLDESHYHRRISLDQLRTMGFGRAQGAADTIEAWELIKKTNPHLVLMEWLDGPVSGLDFARRVRGSEELPNRAVPIFMLTSRASAADVEDARRAGVNGFLVKPISALVLQQRIRVTLTKPVPFIVTASYVGPCRRRRRDEFYTGPMRRLDDVVPDDASPEDHELKAELARARVAALEAKARNLQPGDASAARQVFKATNDLLEVADMISDANLAFGAKEMMRYLQAQGATVRLDPEVVRTHVAALHQLVHLPPTMLQERERVAQSLKKMVDKKLKQAAA